ncbi:glycerophosphodiester phosphodiesterase [Nocardioides insulae]|uniref:glycerophosphodiester phosphodiesterase n=1 Tax=Nocardioides insulae TaxID=394734 RepID=UPI001FDFB323|nr:glycerophosphodiester phosphodiesterase family protein [Nocardioides insulae]
MWTTTAHRGASAYAPENTLAAFAVAIAQRADALESDVQLSRDGVPVLLHDATLSRTTDVERVFPDRAPWNVGDFTLAEIKRLDAGSWFGAEWVGERVPTLAELIGQVRRTRTGILMELKSPGLHPGLERAVADTFAGVPGYLPWALARGRLTVQSFDWNAMAIYASLQPGTPVGLLGTPAVDDLPDLTWARQINPHASALSSEYVAAVHRHGLAVHTWTLDDPERMHAALDQGVDGVITNRPDVLGRLLAERAGAGTPAA